MCGKKRILLQKQLWQWENFRTPFWEVSLHWSLGVILAFLPWVEPGRWEGEVNEAPPPPHPTPPPILPHTAPLLAHPTLALYSAQFNLLLPHNNTREQHICQIVLDIPLEAP